MSVVDFDAPGPRVPVDRSFLPPVPQELLDRHGARVLHPASAAAVPDEPAPLPTVYRAGTLLMPDSLAQPASFAQLDGALQKIGVGMAAPPAGQCTAGTPLRSVALPPSEGPKATVVDAWTALQQLKATATVDSGLVAQIEPEHLYFSSPAGWWNGSPHEGSAQPPGSGYDGRRATGRLPVAVVAPAPRRQQELVRRPVVAVLDTGLGPHPWWNMPDRGVEPDCETGVRVWTDLQNEILAAEKTAAGTLGTEMLDDWLDTPMANEALLGDIDTDTGHGTFITGIIRQAAPDADVLAIRVMHSDGVAYESDVLRALRAIAARVREAQAANDEKHRTEMVDIVSMSCGYFAEQDHDRNPGPNLRAVLEELSDLGVLVVAAAGNHATTRHFYPAAFATHTRNGRPLVLSVGALNTNGTKAMFSNNGAWVQNWATGVGVVSTYPTDIRGPQQPWRVLTSQHRATPDWDDFASGFAIWDGTSFAAPLLAAKLANVLIGDKSLTDFSEATTKERAQRVLCEATEESKKARATRVRRARTGDQAHLVEATENPADPAAAEPEVRGDGSDAG
jgi:hypothetical protein